MPTSRTATTTSTGWRSFWRPAGWSEGAKGRGIGAAIAEAFCAEGAQVWITDLNVQAADDVAKRKGRGARSLGRDVRRADDWFAARCAILSQDGRLDVLVNNAGVTGLEHGGAQDVETVHLDDWRAVLATNLEGVVLGRQMAIRSMRPAGGSIINIASRSGHVGAPAAAADAASKAAVLNHTRTVALYCAERQLNIRCNAISPAAILTPMWDPLLGVGPDRENRMAEFVADTPLRRFGEPAEVAALAVLLASDAACSMTGSDLPLDGVLLARSAARPKKT